ncbi:MAG: hypothetical protein AAGC67_19175 [Myxococcota bacterium]
MRQTVLALVVLSTVAFAQNVLAIAPAPHAVVEASQSATAALPPVGSLALLVGGLFGLTAAGRRFEGREEA